MYTISHTLNLGFISQGIEYVFANTDEIGCHGYALPLLCVPVRHEHLPVFRATGVAGDPEFPVNRGALCVKGWTSVGTLAHPDRLLTPLIRAADGELKPASWEAALDRVIEGIRRAQERYGTDVVGPAAHGAPNFVDKTIWTGGNLDIGQATALCRKSRLP